MTTDKIAELEAEIRRSLQVYRGWTSDSDAAVNLESSVKGILKLADQYTTTVAKEAKLVAAQHIKDICPITDGTSALRLHNRIDIYIDALTKSNREK